ncbi:uncharacterized protein LOC120325537 [Styela clava]|uniref:transmembrane protein 263-like n=1 Tax=Styela clava TaxID=7725 RepID=UPI00193A05D4|nr:transmembrane protein 263-like [Styela clava]
MKDPYEKGVSYEDSKKTDAPEAGSQPQGGILWRLGSGLYNTTTGAVGAGLNLGCGAVKYVAQTSYGVVSKTAEVGVNATKAVASGGYNGVSAVTSKLPVPSFSKQKDKKE